jgi:hypothetical protein
MSKSVRIFILSIIIIAACGLTQSLTAKKFIISPLLKSAVLPGWGQVSIDRSYGYAFLTGEALSWSAYYYAKTEQKLKGRASYEYALEFAHVNPGNYSDQYYRDLAKYNSSGYETGGYNAMVRQAALNLPNATLEEQQAYIDAHAIPDDMAWNWDSTNFRKKYTALRNDILVLKDQAQIMTGVLIANHLVSTIDILRLKKHWKNVQPSVQYYKNTAFLNLSVGF